jgi:uncharacterized iron-regulated protein
MIGALVAGLLLTQAANPYALPIGRPGSWLAFPGRMIATTDNRVATPDDVARAARGRNFVYLGEQHATAPHQQMMAQIIDALARDGRRVVVGLEMLQRPKQEVLNRWSAGQINERELLEQADWKGQWGFDFGYYRPIFDVARKHNAPVLGLNVPRDWVRAVGRGGLAALTDEQKAQLPGDMVLDNKAHRDIFLALIGGGHPGMTQQSFDNMYAAQVLWDEAMADTIVRHIGGRRLDNRTVYVVVAGIGHLMFDQGINYRLQRRGYTGGVTVSMITSHEPVRVAAGLGDFVYVSPVPTPATGPGG